MNVLFSSLRNTSHFLPLVPFIEACRHRGHDVAVAAPADLAERVGKTSARFFPLGHPGDAGLRPFWARMPGASEEEQRRIAVGEIFAGVCASSALPGLFEALNGFRADVIVRESQEYAGLLAAEKLGIPHVRVAITAPGGEAELVPLATPALEEHRQKLGLTRDPQGERLRDEPVLTRFPESFGAAADARTPPLRFRVAREPAPPLKDWWGGRRGPFVYATLGTVVGGSDAMRAAYRLVLDAVSELPARVLLTVGAELPLETLGALPANVHVERFVPQDEVMPHAAVVLCHGGSGTVLGALAAGAPLVVMPMFADQPFNAERVAAAGAGLALPRARANVETLRAALTRVLDGAEFRAAAQATARELAALPAIEDAPLELERLVAQSRSDG